MKIKTLVAILLSLTILIRCDSAPSRPANYTGDDLPVRTVQP